MLKKISPEKYSEYGIYRLMSLINAVQYSMSDQDTSNILIIIDNLSAEQVDANMDSIVDAIGKSKSNPNSIISLINSIHSVKKSTVGVSDLP